jgi:hypothetical protein
LLESRGIDRLGHGKEVNDGCSLPGEYIAEDKSGQGKEADEQGTHHLEM